MKRIRDNRISKTILDRNSESRRRKWKPREQWMDEVRRNMNDKDLTKEDAKDRELWRS